MSQSQTIATSVDSLPKTPGAAIHHTQVAPQKPIKATTSKSKVADKSTGPPDFNDVKSPLPAGSQESHPASRAGSFKGSLRSKGGFLSLFFCCAFGGGSLTDHGDKSASGFSRRRRKISHGSHIRDSRTSTTTDIPKTESEKLSQVADDIKFDSNTESQVDTHPCGKNSTDIDTPLATPHSPSPQSPEGQTSWLLPPLSPEYSSRKCLVLDLDETLVHSSFKMIPNPDFVVPVEIDNQHHNVYVLKRPGVDEFMRQMGEIYEIVVFTASLSKYADPVLDILDKHRVIQHRLFRESCYHHKGTYVKNLSQLGRNLTDTLILDNSPASYIFHNANAVPVSTWFNDPHDTELTDLVAFLNDLTKVDDVTMVLDNSMNSTIAAK